RVAAILRAEREACLLLGSGPLGPKEFGEEGAMKVTNGHIRNFRLLQDVDIALDAGTTMVGGRNNSGKTSLVEVVRKFFGSDAGRFNFDDMSLTTHAEFAKALEYYDEAEEARASNDLDVAAEKEALYRATVPAIE